MIQTTQHWNAAHPNFRICLFLIIGIFLAWKYPIHRALHITQYGLSIIFMMIGTLFLIRYGKPLFVPLVLMVWGYILQATQQWHSPIDTNGIYQIIFPIKAWVLTKIDFYFTLPDANAFAKAMLLGEKTKMSSSIKEAYLTLGIVHIIAISGMHLEIIYQYFQKIYNLIPYLKNEKTTKCVFLLTTVCLYTFMANASPSVVRASLFFSIYLMGQYFELHKYTLNSIASGLLIITLLNTATLFHIGWQLSYAAVLGIHFISPIIQNKLSIENPIIQSVWKNFSITIATQLTTLPLLILYFHQVSLWMVLSNLIMVPLSNLLLHGLVIFILSPHFFLINAWLANIIQTYILLLHQCVAFLYQNGPSPLQMSNVQLPDIIVFYLILLLLAIWSSKRQAHWLFWAIVLASLYFLLKLFSIG